MRITVPENILPENVQQGQIRVRLSMFDNHGIRSENQIVSPTYWITPNFQMTKPINIQLQHCAANSQQELFFMKIPDDHGEVTKLDQGVFGKVTGSVERNEFSGLVIAAPRSVKMEMLGRVFYKVSGQGLTCIEFIVTLKLDILLLVIFS